MRIGGYDFMVVGGRNSRFGSRTDAGESDESCGTDASVVDALSEIDRSVGTGSGLPDEPPANILAIVEDR